jgi:hypothetical protein
VSPIFSRNKLEVESRLEVERPIVFFRLDGEQYHQSYNLQNCNLTYDREGTDPDIPSITRVSGGATSNDRTVEETVERILEGGRIGNNQIIIDEYVFLFRNNMKTLRTAVAAAKRINPDLQIIMWNNTWVTPKAAKFFREYIDMIFIESYWPWKSRPMLWLFFKTNYHVVRKHGLLNRTVFILGINDDREKRKESLRDGDWWAYLPWANDEKTLRKQITYVRDRCPGTQGIGFFVKKSSDDIVYTADRLAGELIFEQ